MKNKIVTLINITSSHFSLIFLFHFLWVCLTPTIIYICAYISIFPQNIRVNLIFLSNKNNEFCQNTLINYICFLHKISHLLLNQHVFIMYVFKLNMRYTKHYLFCRTLYYQNLFFLKILEKLINKNSAI
jgi:hypothetical protein